MSAMDFTLLVFACLRLSSLWFEEIARPLRDRIIQRGGRVAYLARCPLCISVWSASAVVALWASPVHYAVYVLAVSGGMISLDRLLSFQTADAIRQLAFAVQSVRVVRDGSKVTSQ